ncbi:hypothetical protein RND71_025482 [Anisodus tanguticus]|uniref:Uncharacterized protein n=1 Tax=Anisodus tanguticus TaxID=243964 RepID=A0AAE1RT15_9SOLA|nr:hypothetical protein RND71_025482 [Anisodus tanguticus]
MVMLKACNIEKIEINRKEENNSGKRELAFVLLATAGCKFICKNFPDRGGAEARDTESKEEPGSYLCHNAHC